MANWKRKDTGKDLSDEYEDEDDEEEKPVRKPKSSQKNIEERDAVVKDLPQIPTRKVRGEDGVIYNVITETEAIQLILEGVRELLKRTED